MRAAAGYAGGTVAAFGALAAAYYAIPFFVAVISLGEICPYSPKGVDLCGESSTVPVTTSANSAPVDPRLCKKQGIRYAGTTTQGAEVCFTLTADRTEWVEIGFRFVRASGCPHEAGIASKTGRATSEPVNH